MSYWYGMHFAETEIVLDGIVKNVDLLSLSNLPKMMKFGVTSFFVFFDYKVILKFLIWCNLYFYVLQLAMLYFYLFRNSENKAYCYYLLLL